MRVLAGARQRARAASSPFGVVRQLFEPALADAEARDAARRAPPRPRPRSSASLTTAEAAARRSRPCTACTGSPNLAEERAAAARRRRPALVRPAVAAVPRLPRAAPRGPAGPGGRRPARGGARRRPGAARRARARPAVARVRPGPLSAAAAVALCEERLGAAPDAELRRRLPRGHRRQPAAPERAAEGARARACGRTPRTSAPSATSARAPSRARCCCGSRGCRGRRARSRARSRCSATAPSCPRRRARRASTGGAPRAATGELAQAEILRPEHAARLRPSARARRRLPGPAARASASSPHARAARAAATRGAPLEQVAAQLLHTAARRALGRATCCGGGAGRHAQGAADSAVAYLRRALDEPPPDASAPARCSSSAWPRR